MSETRLLTKRVGFSSSHRYWNPDWSDQKNKEVFGKHSSEHGHNFILDVTVEGTVDQNTGMIVNLFDLKEILKDVTVELDHKNLNIDVDYFQGIVPTPENIARILWDLIDNKLEGELTYKLYNLRLYESPDLYIDYRREK